jgi:hypothetical protein
MQPQHPSVAYHTYNNVVHHYAHGTPPNTNNIQNPGGPGVAYHYAPANVLSCLPALCPHQRIGEHANI